MKNYYFFDGSDLNSAYNPSNYQFGVYIKDEISIYEQFMFNFKSFQSFCNKEGEINYDEHSCYPCTI